MTHAQHQLESILRTYHHERHVVGRKLAYTPTQIGHLFGITDQPTINYLNAKALAHVDVCINAVARTGEGNSARPHRYVTKDNKLITR